MKYKKVKLFDCQDMPDNVRKEFFNRAGSPSFSGSNDCVVQFYCFPERKQFNQSGGLDYWDYKGGEILYDKTEKGQRYIIERGDNIVSDWLFDNGAKIFEEVFIQHWW